MKKPEILSPAGNLEKLKAALNFGADAVYFGGERFGMRAAAGNFSLDDIREACEYTHAAGKKLYLTLNSVLKTIDTQDLYAFLKAVKKLPDRPDAAICADLGVLFAVREILPDMDLHISTQANVQNGLTCKAWQSLGAKRIILARELSFEDIKTIRAEIPEDIELECFVHGAMCVAYSGRCLLSNYFVSRDASSGACSQPCRWKYTVTEEKREALPLPIYEDNKGAYLFSSRDLCMIDHIKDLAEAGINSFKIEGRMKSAYYTAVITNAYRLALDSYYLDPADYAPDPKIHAETESVSHREYDTGFFYARPEYDAKICKKTEYIREKAYLGIVIAYEEDTKRAVLRQVNKTCVGQQAQILTPGRVGYDVFIDEMFDEDDNPISNAPHPMMIFKINVPAPVLPGDILRSAAPV